MLLFLFFLVFLLYDVQLVIPYHGIILYCLRNCSHCLQVFLYHSGARRCLSFRFNIDSLWHIQNSQGNFKN